MFLKPKLHINTHGVGMVLSLGAIECDEFRFPISC